MEEENEVADAETWRTTKRRKIRLQTRRLEKANAQGEWGAAPRARRGERINRKQQRDQGREREADGKEGHEAGVNRSIQMSERQRRRAGRC